MSQMQRFVSKRDLRTGIIIWFAAAFALFLTVLDLFWGQGSYVWIITLLLAAALIDIWFYTSYTLTPTHLIVHYGHLLRWKAELTSLSRVRPSAQVLTSPALSLDRLEIEADERGSLLISPKERVEFLNALYAAAPHVWIEGACYRSSFIPPEAGADGGQF